MKSIDNLLNALLRTVPITTTHENQSPNCRITISRLDKCGFGMAQQSDE